LNITFQSEGSKVLFITDSLEYWWLYKRSKVYAH